MNIHPIFVHFPVALLTVYAVLELLRFKTLTDKAYWFYVKAVILIAGTLGAFVSLSSGEGAEHALSDRSLRPLVEMHSTFANASSWIFGILAVVYLISWISKTSYNEKLVNSMFSKIWHIKVMIAEKILGSYATVILALAGLAAITITGALGGAIVYGPDVDPIVSWVYHLFY